MEIKPIHTEADYKAALKAVAPYFVNEPKLGTVEANFFEAMLTLISNYESNAFNITSSPPQ